MLRKSVGIATCTSNCTISRFALPKKAFELELANSYEAYELIRKHFLKKKYVLQINFPNRSQICDFCVISTTL